MLADYLRKLKDSLLLDFSYLAGVPLRPGRIYLGITPACPCRCQMCDLWREKHPPGGLDTAAKLEVLDRLYRELGSFEVSFYGGEPTLRFDELLALTQWCAEHGVAAQFNTNAFLLDDRRREQIVAAGIRRITLSLDALEPELHDRLRGRDGVFAKVMESLEHFQELRRTYPRFDCEVFSVLMEPTLPHLPRVARFCRERGLIWDYQEIMGTFAFGNRPFTPEWWQENPLFVRDLTRLDQTLAELAALGFPAARLARTRDYFRHPDRPRPCAVGYTNLVIDYQGELKFCFLLGAFGTWQDPILATWRHSPRAQAERRRTLTCPLPCSLLQCNIYQPTWTKVSRRLAQIIPWGSSR